MSAEGINREPSPYWRHQEVSVEIPQAKGAYSDVIGERVTESFAEFQQQMNRRLYADDRPYVPPTRWQRFMNWLGDNRITNAWLVLIGREDIDREYR